MNLPPLAALVALLAADIPVVPPEANAMTQGAESRPQITTTGRLLKVGETIQFTLRLPEGMSAGSLSIFPRYLERADPGQAFAAGGDLDWLQALPSEACELEFVNGQAQVAYRPLQAGSYLARWQVEGEALHRYFAAIEEDWIVLRLSAFEGLEVDPTLHGLGIPLDYRLPAERFSLEDPLCRRFLDYQRRYGDSVVPVLPDMPDSTNEERVAAYGPALERARGLHPDPSEVRSARLSASHPLDPGYTETLAQLGINDRCGLIEANAKPWLGMPEFPYFASGVDGRKANQGEGGAVVAHQWDFCGGWHFLGPVSWHYKAAEGDWQATQRCLKQGLEELQLLAELSGHAAFAVPLYDGLVGPGYPNPAFQYSMPERRHFNGAVDEVFVCDRALSAEELQAVIEQGVGALDEPLGAWALEEGTGDRVEDASGAGNDGALSGGAQWVKGRTGPAIELDGEEGQVTMDSPLAIGTREFTLGCWVRPGATQKTWANLLSSHNNDALGGYRGVSIEQDADNTNTFYLIAGMGDRWVGLDTRTSLLAGKWQHFAVTRKGTKLTHYLNGQVSAEGTVPQGVFAPATEPFRIGNWARGDAGPQEDMRRFVDRYQRFMGFEAPKAYKVVYARSIDIADYYRRHFTTTPRTVFVSKTDHLLYDMWWLCTWCGPGELIPRQRIPWDTRISTIMSKRRTQDYWKDPLSCEYILIEDRRRSIRFERECPNPIWWFDYTKQERGPGGSAISHTETPDVTILRSEWRPDGRQMTLSLAVRSETRFVDYAIALWGLPEEFDPAAPITTNAKEAILAKNTDGEHHLVLVFDLEPQMQLTVTVGRR